MATAKKRGPDQWRCLLYVGKDVTRSGYKSFTGKTKKEAERKALAFESVLKENNLTVGEAIDRYIQSKTAVLSPSTIVGYKKIRRNNLSSLMPIRAAALTQEMVQRAINQEVAAGASPRTQRNIVALLSPSLKMFGYTMPKVSLSQKEKKEREIPTTAQVQQLLHASTGDLHFAILLAAELGLSRSEICALTRADFAGGLVHIHAAVVQNDKKEWVVKPPKETARYRSLPLTPAIADIVSGWPVLDDTRVISITPGALSSNFYVLCKKVLPRTYGLHALRHYNVSLMLAANIPPKYIIDRTGHETTKMVDTVYGHIIHAERDAATEKFNAFLAKQTKGQ